MTTLLRIDASALSNHSHSKNLADYIQTEWQAKYPNGIVILTDVSISPPPHIDETLINAMESTQPTPEQQKTLLLSEQLIRQVKQADFILISTPMYNFGIPSTLKAYFDHIVRPGETFSYTEQGPVGLLQNKKAMTIMASGGDYRHPPLNSMDHVNSYLQTILGFIGIKDVVAFDLAGTAKSSEEVAQSIETTKKDIQGYFKG